MAFAHSLLSFAVVCFDRLFGIGGMFSHGAGVGLTQTLVVSLLAVLHLR
jgi:hypothetical protein